MEFSTPLIEAKFIKRYKRFFVDAALADGTIVTAHCPNTGSMKGLLVEGATVYLTHNDDPKRKLKYTLELMDMGESLVGVNTSRPNHIVAQAIAAQKIPELSGYANLKQEVKYGQNSRIDIYLSDNNKPACYVEVKNTTLREGNAAVFPDAVTSRGLKHLHELINMVKEGHRAVMFYLAHRSDCDYFCPADDIDPAYAQGLREAVAAGVDILCYSCTLSPEKVEIDKKLEIRL